MALRLLASTLPNPARAPLLVIADVPAVFVGNKFAAKIPMKLVHSIAAGIFAVMGLLTLFQVDKFFQ